MQRFPQKICQPCEKKGELLCTNYTKVKNSLIFCNTFKMNYINCVEKTAKTIAFETKSIFFIPNTIY